MTLKYILIFIAVITSLGVIVYGVSVYDKHKSREYDISERELEYMHFKDSTNAVNDSLKIAITGLKEDINNLGKEKERIKQVYIDKTKKDISKPASEQGQILKELINR